MNWSISTDRLLKPTIFLKLPGLALESTHATPGSRDAVAVTRLTGICSGVAGSPNSI